MKKITHLEGNKGVCRLYYSLISTVIDDTQQRKERLQQQTGLQANSWIIYIHIYKYI